MLMERMIMRLWAFVAVLLISACASNAPDQPHGSQIKSGWSESDKILQADATYEQPGTSQCNQGRVLYCTTRASGTACNCVYVRNVDERVMQMTGSDRRGNSRHHRQHRF